MTKYNQIHKSQGAYLPPASYSAGVPTLPHRGGNLYDNRAYLRYELVLCVNGVPAVSPDDDDDDSGVRDKTPSSQGVPASRRGEFPSDITELARLPGGSPLAKAISKSIAPPPPDEEFYPEQGNKTALSMPSLPLEYKKTIDKGEPLTEKSDQDKKNDIDRGAESTRLREALEDLQVIRLGADKDLKPITDQQKGEAPVSASSHTQESAALASAPEDAAPVGTGMPDELAAIKAELSQKFGATAANDSTTNNPDDPRKDALEFASALVAFADQERWIAGAELELPGRKSDPGSALEHWKLAASIWREFCSDRKASTEDALDKLGTDQPPVNSGELGYRKKIQFTKQRLLIEALAKTLAGDARRDPSLFHSPLVNELVAELIGTDAKEISFMDAYQYFIIGMLKAIEFEQSNLRVEIGKAEIMIENREEELKVLEAEVAKLEEAPVDDDSEYKKKLAIAKSKVVSKRGAIESLKRENKKREEDIKAVASQKEPIQRKTPLALIKGLIGVGKGGDDELLPEVLEGVAELAHISTQIHSQDEWTQALDEFYREKPSRKALFTLSPIVKTTEPLTEQNLTEEQLNTADREAADILAPYMSSIDWPRMFHDLFGEAVKIPTDAAEAKTISLERTNVLRQLFVDGLNDNLRKISDITLMANPELISKDPPTFEEPAKTKQRNIGRLYSFLPAAAADQMAANEEVWNENLRERGELAAQGDTSVLVTEDNVPLFYCLNPEFQVLVRSRLTEDQQGSILRTNILDYPDKDAWDDAIAKLEKYLFSILKDFTRTALVSQDVLGDLSIEQKKSIGVSYCTNANNVKEFCKRAGFVEGQKEFKEFVFSLRILDNLSVNEKMSLGLSYCTAAKDVKEFCARVGFVEGQEEFRKFILDSGVINNLSETEKISLGLSYCKNEDDIRQFCSRAGFEKGTKEYQSLMEALPR